jgi:hypothetical protein
MRILVAAFVLLGITAALAQNITGGLNNAQQIIGGAGSGGGFNIPGVVVSSGGGGGGGSCSGTIDLSNGCPQAMLGY